MAQVSNVPVSNPVIQGLNISAQSDPTSGANRIFYLASPQALPLELNSGSASQTAANVSQIPDLGKVVTSLFNGIEGLVEKMATSFMTVFTKFFSAATKAAEGETTTVTEKETEGSTSSKTEESIFGQIGDWITDHIPSTATITKTAGSIFDFVKKGANFLKNIF